MLKFLKKIFKPRFHRENVKTNNNRLLLMNRKLAFNRNERLNENL
jgi:hypothetical protein